MKGDKFDLSYRRVFGGHRAMGFLTYAPLELNRSIVSCFEPLSQHFLIVIGSADGMMTPRALDFVRMIFKRHSGYSIAYEHLAIEWVKNAID